MTRRRIEPPDPRRLRTAYETHSIGDLARLYAVSPYTLRSWLMEYQIPRRPAGTKVPQVASGE